MLKLFLFMLGSFMLCGSLGWAAGGSSGHGHDVQYDFPISEEKYAEMEREQAVELGREGTLVERLKLRATADPFNMAATAIFFFAVVHTFMAGKFNRLAHKYEHLHSEKIKHDKRLYVEGKEPVSLKATLFHFLGEVEAVFGIWLIPLLIVMVLMQPHGIGVASYYIDSRNFTEPVFVVIIMAIASSRPVIQFAERCLELVAGLGKKTPGAWWLSILVIAPLLGSFITEPAAMTIAALLLGHQFYVLKPTRKFKYATLGLLFVNISVGGTLTHFAAPPVLMVASSWGWDVPFMLMHFGWRVILGILLATSVYFYIFRREFSVMKERAKELQRQREAGPKPEPVPAWVIVVHLAFVAWTVITLHHPPFFVGGFLFFIAFTMATHHHQFEIKLKSPLLVGFFLAGLVAHGGLQGWWISPVLSSLTEVPLFFGSTILTAFNDNAAITFLASQVPAFDQHLATDTARALALQYAVVAGAVTGGGLTVIANAPNPAGQSILNKYFDGGISPLNLCLAAIFPTVVMACMFILLPH